MFTWHALPKHRGFAWHALPTYSGFTGTSLFGEIDMMSGMMGASAYGMMNTVSGGAIMKGQKSGLWP